MRLRFYTILILFFNFLVFITYAQDGSVATRISGTLLMLDNATPHVAVQVQAVQINAR
jgi:hypothetical protein